jgi:hypothetical protein
VILLGALKDGRRALRWLLGALGRFTKLVDIVCECRDLKTSDKFIPHDNEFQIIFYLGR